MTKAKRNPATLQIPQTPTETSEQAKARAALRPSVNAVMAIDAFKGNLMGDDVDLGTMVETLQTTIADVSGGDLGKLEAMLVAQATALQTMFTSMARRAASQEYIKNMATYMTLALKAQAQSRATISALVDLKYPKQATFIKQANVAHGPQQVNNGAGPAEVSASLDAHTHAAKPKPDQPELLEADHGGTQMDGRTTPAAARSHPAVEALGAVNGATKRGRKGNGRTQR
jgi:hypothetical protein